MFLFKEDLRLELSTKKEFVMRKPFFGVTDQEKLDQTSSARKTSNSTEMWSAVAHLDEG